MNNKELINAGHALAKAISNDTPLIEIAKMVSNLATQLDVQLARSNALAAENAGLKSAHPQPFGAEMMKALDAYEKHQDETPETGMLDAFFILRDSIRVDTTATDAFLAEVRAQGVKSLSNAVQSVISERQRQQSVEGWTPEHDDEHTEGEMAEAAACYAMFANNQGFSVPGLWPWAREWWKQSGQRRDLVKAGALILAEIERIDRQESAQ